MCQQILVKHPSIVFHENLFSGSGVVICGQTAMAKLIGACLQLFIVNMPKRG
jgi:hypothetical protein